MDETRRDQEQLIEICMIYTPSTRKARMSHGRTQPYVPGTLGEEWAAQRAPTRCAVNSARIYVKAVPGI